MSVAERMQALLSEGGEYDEKENARKGLLKRTGEALQALRDAVHAVTWAKGDPKESEHRLELLMQVVTSLEKQRGSLQK